MQVVQPRLKVRPELEQGSRAPRVAFAKATPSETSHGVYGAIVPWRHLEARKLAGGSPLDPVKGQSAIQQGPASIRRKQLFSGRFACAPSARRLYDFADNIGVLVGVLDICQKGIQFQYANAQTKQLLQSNLNRQCHVLTQATRWSIHPTCDEIECKSHMPGPVRLFAFDAKFVALWIRPVKHGMEPGSTSPQSIRSLDSWKLPTFISANLRQHVTHPCLPRWVPGSDQSDGAICLMRSADAQFASLVSGSHVMKFELQFCTLDMSLTALTHPQAATAAICPL